MRLVLPVGSGSFGSAPALRSAATKAALPLLLARDNGVTPSRFAIRWSAPARISRSASVRSPRYTAQCSAVAPSACAAFTSAFWDSSARTAAASPRMTASATSLPAAPSRIVSPTLRINTNELPALKRLELIPLSGLVWRYRATLCWSVLAIFMFIWNGVLVTMFTTMDENR